MTRYLILCLPLLYMMTGCGCTADPPAPPVTPEAFFESIRNNPNFETSPRGEQFCWHAAAGMHRFVDLYHASGNREFIRQGMRYSDWLISLMDTAPDGYKGWIGPYIYDASVWCDVHVGDAILLTQILGMAECILADDVLKAEAGGRAREYIAITQKDFIEKWDARGTWKTDGPYGCYTSYTKFLDPGNLKEWSAKGSIKTGLSLPFNKINDAAQVAMRLYALTGEQQYRERAVKIFSYMKGRFQYFDGHYVWNYWEPFGPWDLIPEKNDVVHWIGVHPYRNYQAGEVHQIEDAYQRGIVFTEDDMQRIIATNLKVMWNGNREKPAFFNANQTHLPRKSTTPPKGWKGVAGTLWTALMPFDRTVRDLYAVRFAGDTTITVARYLYENLTLRSRPGFGRHHADNGLVLFDKDVTPCSELNMAAAIPAHFEKGDTSYLTCKAWLATGELQIDLYSADGTVKVREIARKQLQGGEDGHAGILIYPWVPVDLSGEYRVRWTFKGGYREMLVSITPGG